MAALAQVLPDVVAAERRLRRADAGLIFVNLALAATVVLMTGDRIIDLFALLLAMFAGMRWEAVKARYRSRRVLEAMTAVGMAKRARQSQDGRSP